MSKPHILFVDDEQKILDGFRRMLRPARQQWNMKFLTSGKKALDAMAQQSFDVIISDMRMPYMDGGELLNRVKKLYPSTIRFILSGHADKEMILRTIGPTHRFFTKPCDADVLIDALSLALVTRSAMNRDKLGAVVSGSKSLPVMPELYMDLNHLLQERDVSIDEIEELISRDVALAAEILHVVNSSYFGLPKGVQLMSEALQYLGDETIREIVLSRGLFKKLSPQIVKLFRLKELEEHSSKVAILAAKIVQSKNSSNATMIDNARVSGLLHDIGKFVLIANICENYDIGV